MAAPAPGDKIRLLGDGARAHEPHPLSADGARAREPHPLPSPDPVALRSPGSAARRVARCAVLSVCAYACAIYLCLLVLLAAPSAQALLICMHTVKYVVRADYADPASVFVLGARHLRLRADAGSGSGADLQPVELGMWHVLPAGSLDALAAGADDIEGGARARAASLLFDAALEERGGLAGAAVVLFLHGNGEHRAMHQGPVHARAISAALGAHALLLDYRGFGDSSGWPTEEGLASDARAAYDWLTVQRGVRPSRVLIWGHSLGSAVAARLAAELAAQPASELPLGLVLESAFTSLPELLPDYPLGRAVCWLPGVHTLMWHNLAFRMDSRRRLGQLAASAPELPVLLLHGARDSTVPIAHSRALLDAARAAGARRASLVELALADHHTVLASNAALLAAGELIAAAHARDPAGRRAERGRGGEHSESSRPAAHRDSDATGPVGHSHRGS